MLISYYRQIGEELNQMKMKEKYINNQYNTLCLEYVEVDLLILPLPSDFDHSLLFLIY